MATLTELAELVGGRVAGNGEVEIHRVASIDAARGGDITFIANPKYLARLQDTQAAAVIVKPGIESPGVPLLLCDNPYLAFAKILTALHVRRPEPRGILPGALVDPEAHIGPEVTLHPGCVVGRGAVVGRGSILYPGVVLYEDTVVGEDCTLHAGAIVREQCRLGDRVILQPGAVIGSDGFGFAPDGGAYYKIPQVGIVVVEDDVEIGANTCIDRAALGETRIGRGSKIDNLAQVAHNVVIGEDTIIVAQVGISGSTRIGNHCTLGGQVGVVGHIKIGDHTMVGAQSGVINSLPGRQVVSGTPAIAHKDWLKASASFAQLPDMRRDISRLKRQLADLANKLEEK
jgi:UDP-3-O-[3-hydroxymyristoyl] glucosamine N-acyltransferase